jgi:hypothetical protein
MDPAALNDRIGRRVNLLRTRAVDRASNLVLEAFAFHPDRNTVQSHLASQVDILSAREPHVLDKDAKFVAKVLEERVKIALEAERQQQTQQAQDRDDTGAGAFVASAAQRSVAEVQGRYQQLHQAFIQADAPRAGYLDYGEILRLCRCFQLASPNLDQVFALCQKNPYGQFSYLSFAERLKQLDFPTQNANVVGGQNRAVVDEWGALAKTQADVVDAYEQQKRDVALAESVQNRRELRRQADERERLQREANAAEKRREREEADRNAMLVQAEQARVLEEKLAQRAVENQARREQIERKQQVLQQERAEMQLWAKGQVRQAVDNENQAYLEALRKKAEERKERGRAQEISNRMKALKDAEKEKELLEDKERMKQWEAILAKEDSIRRANLAKATSYQPPPALIEAAENVTAKAKVDEQRALDIQQQRLQEGIRMDEEAKRLRKQAELDMYTARKEQEDVQLERRAKERARDKSEADALMQQVELSLRMEREESESRRMANLQYGQELRQQALANQTRRQNAAGRMSPREKVYNQSLLQELQSPTSKSTFQSTARRIFG